MALARPAEVQALIEAWPEGCRLLLLAGRDEGQARLLAARAARALSAGAPPLRLSGAELAADPPRLADEAASLSLFGARPSIHASGTAEELARAIALLLEAPAAANPVVAETGELRRGDRLYDLCAADPRAVLVLCHPPDARSLAGWVRAEGERQGVRMTAEAAARLVALAGADASVLAREVEKLALYAGAHPSAPRPVGSADVEAVASRTDGEGELAGLSLALVAGEGAAFERELRRAAAGAIPALRATGRRLVQLLELRRAVEAGARPEEAVAAARPPVFWKERAALAAALGRWDRARISAALEALQAAETAVKARGSAGEVLAWQTLAMLCAGHAFPSEPGLC